VGFLIPGGVIMSREGGTSGNRFPYIICMMFLVLILFQLLPFASDNASAQNPQTQFNFLFPESTLPIEVGPGDAQQVIFEGEIEMKHFIPQARQVLVSLNWEIRYDEDSVRPSIKGWTASVSPVQMFLDPLNKVFPIRVVVKSTLGENKDVHYTIILSGTWRSIPGGEGGTIGEFPLHVYTLQYYNIRIFSPHAFTTGFPGEARTYTLSIMNQGNGPDFYEIHFDDLEEHLEPTGWVIRAPSWKTETIAPSEMVNYTFEVHGPQKRWPELWKTRVSEIPLRVESGAARKSGFVDEMGRSTDFRRYSVFYQEKGTRYDIEPCMFCMMAPVILLILINMVVVVSRRFARGKRENLP